MSHQDEVHVGMKVLFMGTWKNDDVPIDISTATTKEIVFTKPISGTKETKTAVFAAGQDGTNGRMQYRRSVAEMDEWGEWSWQGHVITPTDELWSPVQRVHVYPNL